MTLYGSFFVSCDFFPFRFERNEKFELVEENCTSDCHYTRVTEERDAIDDATAGMLIVVLLFILPAVPCFWPFTSKKIRMRAF